MHSFVKCNDGASVYFHTIYEEQKERNAGRKEQKPKKSLRSN